jgi:hypothetical protein
VSAGLLLADFESAGTGELRRGENPQRGLDRPAQVPRISEQFRVIVSNG